MNHQEYLRVIDQVIEKGPYSATWKSLSRHMTPQWYQDAKFGIFIHWGVFSVPERASEWHLRNMHVKGQSSYQIHREKYGEPKYFGYHDLIPLFIGEKFDPDAWATLFQNCGAKFVMPVAEHHDGFQMVAWSMIPVCQKILIAMIYTGQTEEEDSCRINFTILPFFILKKIFWMTGWYAPVN